MRRVKAYFDWEASLWDDRAGAADDEGLQAYAFRQASIRRSLRERFERSWANVEKAEAASLWAQKGDFKRFEYNDLFKLATEEVDGPA